MMLTELIVSKFHGTNSQKLNGSDCENIKSIQGLEQLTKLREINVSHCDVITKLSCVEFFI